MKSAFSTVVWIGRATVSLVGLFVIVALVFGAASTAFAGNGDFLKLGSLKNSATRITGLAGSAGVDGPMLRIDNNNGGANASALDLQVEPGQAPLTVSPSAGTATNLDADTLDNLDSTDFARAYKRTVVVSPVPGDPAASGTAFKNALAGITDASESNPYLLKVEPGLYDLGRFAAQMKQWVDIEGSGEGVTTLTATSNQSSITGTLKGASNSELRLLTVENVAGTDDAQVAAIYNDGASPRLTNVTVSAPGSKSFSDGVLNVRGSSPVMTDVTIEASGVPSSTANSQATGVRNEGGSSPVIRDSTITASGADNNTAMRSVLGGTVRVDNSRLVASDFTVLSYNGTTTLVGASQLEGGPADSDGAGSVLTCAGVYDEGYAFSPGPTCP